MNHRCSPVIAAIQDEVSSLALQLWKRAGCPEGRDLDFWLAAETRRLAPQMPEAQIVPPVAPQPASRNVVRA